VLAFSATRGFRHDSIPAAVSALTGLAKTRAWTLRATEDPSVFNNDTLKTYNVIVFLLTTGDVLDATQQAAVERFIQAGNGFVGIHSASDTEYAWPWYGGLVGAYFKAHPAIQEAKLNVEQTSHPATRELDASWTRTDEWYGFRTNPRSTVSVLLSLDETSYAPGDGSMNGDHPIAWSHVYDGGRAFYTGLGHTKESYNDARFLSHITGGIEWAAGRE
jgi:type 1 glutamine amidotransferase